LTMLAHCADAMPPPRHVELLRQVSKSS
jgi:hypothetical protein